MTDEVEDRDDTSDDDGTGGPPDPVVVALAALDPGLADAPPVRGSARHHSILEYAMTITSRTTTTVPDDGRPAGMDPTRAIRSPRRRLALLAAAAALLAVIVGTVVVLEPWRQATPASARQVLRSAATATGDVASLRAAGTYDHLGNGVVIKMTSEIDGADYSATFRRTGGPDDDPGDESTTLIGDTGWETHGGRTTKRTVPPEERNAPFPESSEAVVKAALVGSKVTDLGIEAVRGQKVTHYRIQLTPASTGALAKLTPSQLARFELEYPQDVASLDVWVADDLIRRISVRSDSKGVGASTIEFYDFGADITIRPPK